MNNETIIKLPKQVEELTSQLDSKASKDDVARISSGTPLFASSTSGMTDTTKNLLIQLMVIYILILVEHGLKLQFNIKALE